MKKGGIKRGLLAFIMFDACRKIEFYQEKHRKKDVAAYFNRNSLPHGYYGQIGRTPQESKQVKKLENWRKTGKLTKKQFDHQMKILENGGMV